MFGEKSFIKDRRYETFNIGLIQVIRDEYGSTWSFHNLSNYFYTIQETRKIIIDKILEV